MDQTFCRFNLTDLITRDSKETKVTKGKNILIVASLLDEKVILKQVQKPNSLSEPDNELYYFFHLVNMNLALCLGYAIFEYECFLVFEYSTFTVGDLVSQIEYKYADKEDYEISKKKEVFNKIPNILNEFKLRGFYFECIDINQMFINENLDVKIFDLTNLRQGSVTEDALLRLCNDVKKQIFGNKTREMNLEEFAEIVSSKHNIMS